MDITGSVIGEAVATILRLVEAAKEEAVQEGVPSAHDYNKTVFNLEPRHHEEQLKVVIKAKESVEVDCNWSISFSALKKSPEGYYVIGKSAGLTTLMACPPASTSRRMQRVDVQLVDAEIDYDSNKPIVIYAAKGVVLSYEVMVK
ncbi:ecotin family protein [Pseudomonas sp. HN11]|uniref:ecotin family protein n=1 Tax=Pseudomonas sp. HN11 TaxID=1344094 RepID=UPI001F175B1C|nr:ecotin family protein [Pseudomonas sp. HN11]UII73906.1 ecotin family protein [Pseudomonas sp. HN11]